MITITINKNVATVSTDYTWQFGIGCDHAHQLLRTDIAEELKIAHDELGIKSVRFHGIFDDDLYTYGTIRDIAPMPGHKNSLRDINFRQCGFVIDNIKKAGMEPFMELSFMPKALASGKKKGMHYINNTTTPRDYEEWKEYITLFIKFLEDRYGEETVRNWYFEVWNEPDLGIFFGGKQKDYFRLYKETCEAIKSVDSLVKVGGPSTSACKWVDEFVAYCKENRVPYDFISTHHYPGDSFGNLITPANYMGIGKTIFSAMKEKRKLPDVIRDMFYNPDAAAKVPKGALVRMDDELNRKAEGIPTIMSEWNSMAIYGAPIHDEKYSAAFLIKSVLDLKNDFTGYMFWCLSDIFEEITQLNTPFHGGYGIFTIDGIRKPNFWAMKMLSKLYQQRLDMGIRCNEAVDYAVFMDGEKYQVLVLAQDNDPRKKEQYEVEIVLPGRFSNISVETIDDTHCNPKGLWEKMGRPDYLLPEQVKEIQEKSWMFSELAEAYYDDDTTTIHTSIGTNDIKLFTIGV